MLGLAAIKGQDRAVGLLDRARATGKLAHGYLFDGPPGVGKRTTALALAAALSCQRTPGAAHCDCPSCAKIAAGLHPDILRVAPGGAGNFIVIEQIRDLLGQLGFAPHEGRVRLVLIEQADRMHPAAQNAFLKTLEEPPARSLIVLTTSAPERLLVTIRSRCQKLRFAPLPEQVVGEILVRGGQPVEVARTAARLAGGSLTRAQTLTQPELIEARWRRVQAAVRAAEARKLAGAIEAAQGLVEDKEEVQATLDVLALFYRDAAAYAAAPERVAVPALQGYGEALAVLAQRHDAAKLARRAQLVIDAQTALAGFAAAAVTSEALVWALAEAA